MKKNTEAIYGRLSKEILQYISLKIRMLVRIFFEGTSKGIPKEIADKNFRIKDILENIPGGKKTEKIRKKSMLLIGSLENIVKNSRKKFLKIRPVKKSEYESFLLMFLTLLGC